MHSQEISEPATAATTHSSAIELHAFENGYRFDPAMWATDLERFLAHPELASLKDRPEIYRAAATDIAPLFCQ